jgi:hypothetical protein
MIFDPMCWTCGYQQIGGGTFLGLCHWFPAHDKGEAKAITPAIVDKGCKFWVPRDHPGRVNANLREGGQSPGEFFTEGM